MRFLVCQTKQELVSFRFDFNVCKYSTFIPYFILANINIIEICWIECCAKLPDTLELYRNYRSA